MRRPGGVVAVAVVDFTGSGMLVLFTGLMALAALGQFAVRGPAGAPTAAYRAGALVGLSLLYLLPAVWGVVTAIGLLRMRLWAVASTLAFAYLLVCGALGIGIAAAYTPIPALNATDELVIRLLMAGLGLAVLGVGGWWLAYFSRRRVRAQFTAGGGWARRPLSISMLGWLSVLVGILCVAGALLPHPTLTVAGWPVAGGAARVAFAIFAVVQFGVGWGLLKLDGRARIGGLVLYALTVANSLATWIQPQALQRTFDTALARNPAVASSAAARSMFYGFMLLGTSSGVVVGLLCLYYLWTRRAAFYPQQASMIPPLVAQEAGAGEPLPSSPPAESGEEQ